MEYQFIPSETALLVIDMQNAFCHPEGGLAKAGIAVPLVEDIVSNVAELVRACRVAPIPVIWTKQEHYPCDKTRALHRVPTHLDKGQYRLAEKGTWDAEIEESLQKEMRPEDHLVVKHRMSCFYNTNLETKLKMLGISTLIVCGLVTNVCVESTIRDAYFRDYDIIVVEECVGGNDEELHYATLKNVRVLFGEVTRLEKIIPALKKATPV